mmetsp:Transcript_6541/g.13965  ORF Transcript_6541/g.13965 Transcript_6541/m.13965 type:complete len:231 (+) Transcript_6541:98-790(+)
MSSLPLFSDLRGVMVRNTFLEFEDLVNADDEDGLGPDPSLLRQASEPAKPLNRQVSDQTTAYTDFNGDENYSRGPSPMDGVAMPELSVQALANEWAALSVSAADPTAVQVPPQFQMGGGMVAGFSSVPRFCPHCGENTEARHRFCPYCRYQLQWGPEEGAAASSAVPAEGQVAGPSGSGAQEGDAAKAKAVPELLTHLRRFRFVDASEADIELSKALCAHHLQSLRSSQS